MFRFLTLSCVLTSTLLTAAPQPQDFRHPLVFEPNRGQAPAHVKWIARASGYRLLLTDDGATTILSESSEETVRMKLTGGRPWSEINGLEPTGGVSNYLLGSDPRKWRTDIPHYARLRAAQVYDGIDMVFYSYGGDLEYDFVVAPEVDPKQIRLAFEGVDNMRVDGKSGDLLLTTTGGSELRHLRPKVYQQLGKERVEVAGGYEVLDRRHATFTLASYDSRRPLVIDPTVKFTTALAGNKADIPYTLTLDSSGNAYVTGVTTSTNFPRAGALQSDQPGDDAFVTKLSPSGKIVFSTYLGGSGSDVAAGIAVDSTGVYIAGTTDSSDFPIKNSIYPNRSRDAFITKLTLAGNSFIYSSYLGGSKEDYGNGIAIDSAHAAWVVGSTDSEDFPIAGGPSAGQQRTHGGDDDVFLARVAPDGLSVAFSTFVGGPGEDVGVAVAVDRTGSVYASGHGSYGFPVTPGTKPCGIGQEAIAVRLKGPGTQTRYFRCLGPANASGIAVDANFNAYVAGEAAANFPTTPGAFQRTKPTLDPNLSSGFVTKLNSLGAVAYSTYLGGTNGETYAARIAVDRSGAAYVVGQTTATAFPGLPPLKPNSYVGFLSKLTPQGNGLRFSTSFGAAIYGVALFQQSGRPTQMYAAGYKYTGGTEEEKTDAFVIKWE